MAYKLNVAGRSLNLDRPLVGKVTTTAREEAERRDYVFLDPPAAECLTGYVGALRTTSSPSGEPLPTIQSLPYRDHLEDGDIVVLNPGGLVRTLFKVGSSHNSIFTTDRCNSYCVMCSQPPKAVNDRHRIEQNLRLVELIPPETAELGITGGEPTLLGRDLLRLLDACKRHLPRTGLHMLSNGRLFAYSRLARDLAAVEHPDLVVGIPLYAALDFEHDFVVQARGAFEQAVLGLQNLARYDIRLELRVVIHRATYSRLLELAEFIYRNLTFVEHVALMGLEAVGFAISNFQDLWIDPWDYRSELEEAVDHLVSRGMNVSIYNHQLCVVPEAVWPYCRQSISDWKNDYLSACQQCEVKSGCCGFFASAGIRAASRNIKPVRRLLLTPL